MSFGVIINERTALPPKGSPTDTGVGFFTGKVASGPTTAATKVGSMDEFTGVYGARVGITIPLFDSLDAFFGEGGRSAWIGGHTNVQTYADGLALLNDPKKGPGQVSLTATPTTAPVAAALSSFCSSNNRVGLLDVGQIDDVAAMEAKGDLVAANSDLVGVFGSWAQIPPPAGVIGGSARFVPASAVIAGLCNRVDQTGNPNRAAAGRDFPFQYANGIVLDPSDADRAALFTHGVNAFMNDFGVLENYGFQTNVPVSTSTPFWQLNCSRARMWLKANAKAVAAPYVFRNADAEGHMVSNLMSDLGVMCKDLYDHDGLFGLTAQEAYHLSNVTSISDQGLATVHVTLAAKYSLHTKAVEIDLISVPINGSVQ